MKYTIKNIAELAGVSKGTVDRVLHKRGKVSKRSFEKVNKVLEEIDYQPNIIAQNLKKNKNYIVGVLLPNSKVDSYWKPCLDGVNEAIAESKVFGVSIVIYFFDPSSAKSFLEANKLMINSSPNAVLIASLFHKETSSAVENYNKSGIYVATFNNELISSSIKYFVGQDLHKSGRIAAKLLNSIVSNRTVAIIHIDEKIKNATHMQEKEKGFRSYFSDLDNYDKKILKTKLKRSNYEEKLLLFLNENPSVSGVFVTNSKAYLVANVLKKMNWPKIAIVGYDLLDENVSYLKQNVIDYLIHQNPKQQAYLGLTYLIEYLLFNKAVSKQVLLPIDIINSENVTTYISTS